MKIEVIINCCVELGVDFGEPEWPIIRVDRKRGIVAEEDERTVERRY